VAAASGLLVLLVDDEPDQVEMYRLGLEDAGFRVATAYRGDEAVERARKFRPDAIVLDVRLPDLSGWDVCSVLKADLGTEHIPIIILTAAASPTLDAQASAAGCAAYLLKPCFPERLIEALRVVMRAPQA
jgi:CheY-like chemotaxis protein